MTQEQRITALSQAIGADIKELRARAGSLSSLNTSDKSSLVNAINELQADLASSGVQINDNALPSSTTVAYSPAKITALILALKTEILGGASAAYDTLQEIQNELQGDDTAISGLLTAVGKRVAYDALQSLSDAEKLISCQNIGVGNFDRDFATDYTTARDSL